MNDQPSFFLYQYVFLFNGEQQSLTGIFQQIEHQLETCSITIIGIGDMVMQLAELYQVVGHQMYLSNFLAVRCHGPHGSVVVFIHHQYVIEGGEILSCEFSCTAGEVIPSFFTVNSHALVW